MRACKSLDNCHNFKNPAPSISGDVAVAFIEFEEGIGFCFLLPLKEGVDGKGSNDGNDGEDHN